MELVEMEIRELLEEHAFDGENTPFVFGSALQALEVRRGEGFFYLIFFFKLNYLKQKIKLNN